MLFLQYLERVRHDLLAMARTRRWLVLLIFAVTVTLLVGIAVLQTVRALRDEMLAEMELEAFAGAFNEMAAEATRNFVADLHGVSPEALDPAIAASLPMTLMVMGTLMFMPWYALLSSFDGISSEVRSRSLCYLSPRMPRWLVAPARMTALALGLTGIVVLCGGLTFVISLFIAPPVDPMASGVALLRLTPLLFLFVAGFTGVTLSASSLSSSSFAALVLSTLLVLVVSLLTVFARAESGVFAMAGQLAVLSPYRYTAGMYLAGWAPWLRSFISLLAVAAFWTAIAAAILPRRRL